jgi:hypothetical protein
LDKILTVLIMALSIFAVFLILARLGGGHFLFVPLVIFIPLFWSKRLGSLHKNEGDDPADWWKKGKGQ